MWRLNLFAGVIFSVTFSVYSCLSKNKQRKEDGVMRRIMTDPHSFSRPEETVVKHLDLDLLVNFELKKLSGTVELEIDRAKGVEKLVLDSKDLQISSVQDTRGNELVYYIRESDPVLGAAVEIDLKKTTDKVRIEYSTGYMAEALQWLEPEQTANKTDPFLFTQSQAILARSWIPLQDSPGVRFTYTAKVKVPGGYLALMSAKNPQKANEEGIYDFEMEQPIPSYLMCLAVGKIEFSPVGKRTGIYSEPSMLDSARKEFEDMEEMLLIAEELYGPYRWGRYDLIVLPPSFPFGGMENPRITFATPTILAGDKSLTSLVAHELAHSWSGNLVTNATWNDFWLNEGFTVYFEYRIMEALKGKDYADMLSSLSYQGLLNEVESFMKNDNKLDTRLKLDLSGRNPDEGVTTIAYDKGYFFLKYLEQYTGRDKFDPFLNQYFSEFAFQSNHTEAFLSYLDEHLFKKNSLRPVEDLDEWIYGTGLPASLPQVKSRRFDIVDQALVEFQSGKNSFITEGWSSHEWVHFIKNLPFDLSINSLSTLDDKYDFTHSGNSEILGVWYVHCARHMYIPSLGAMEQFLVHTGRRKFLMPIYQELMKSDKGRSFAASVYQKARPNYHFVTSNSLDKLFKLSGDH